jgi:hypothetical protein
MMASIRALIDRSGIFVENVISSGNFAPAMYGTSFGENKVKVLSVENAI